MPQNISEFPKQPLPHVPQPVQPERPHVQPPTVFVYEKQGWEYKVLGRNTAEEPLPTEAELNTLGRDGWELVGVVPFAGGVQFFFKRVQD